MVTGPTHDLGGTLDVVTAHRTVGRGCVIVHDVGLSDHFLLHWQIDTTRRDGPQLELVCTPSWRLLDVDQFCSALSASRICSPDAWPTGID